MPLRAFSHEVTDAVSLVALRFQKFGVSQEEIEISKDEFMEQHAPGGVMEWAALTSWMLV